MGTPPSSLIPLVEYGSWPNPLSFCGPVEYSSEPFGRGKALAAVCD